MRTCDICGEEIHSDYGKLHYLPIRGRSENRDLCDSCGEKLMEAFEALVIHK